MNIRFRASTGLWMAGWFISMLLMTYCGRQATQSLPVTMLMFFRSLIGMIVLVPIIFWVGRENFQTPQVFRHAARGSIHFAAQFSWFSAITLIPLAQVISIEFTMPIWTAIIASFYIGEKIGKLRIAAIVLGFIGILVIVRPGFANVSSGQTFALASAFGFAGSVVLTKKILQRDNALTTLFYMIATQLTLGSVLAVFFWQWPQSDIWIFVFGAGIAGLTSHYCLARALALADSAFITQLDFLRLPFTALLGFAVYDERIGIFLVIGAGLIIISNILNLKQR